ncbi:hypothetical protein [Pendulispora albinea]|uniref:DoxX family protein n=1 Tax=Pendulispora albinea TaxID=2741071 RepID=A0ABZ2LQH9_9BACT
MANISHAHGGLRRDDLVADAHSPAYQAYQILHWGFVILPLIAGLDKFANVLVSWEKYIAPAVATHLPFRTSMFMMFVGVVEIAAALIVAAKPRVGAYIVVAWLLAIIGNLVLVGGYWDIALRDLGLCLGALSLARLSIDYDTPALTATPTRQGPVRP